MTHSHLLIATTNRGKLNEVRAMLDDLAVDVETLDDFPDLPEPVEDQDTFEGNALVKARHYARLTGRLTLADDSGLEVDALGGKPGVHSARYAGDQRDDAANNAKVIAGLSGVPAAQRTARFRCALALVTGEQVVATSSGEVSGLIVDDPRGSNGFGYDPHFYVPEVGMTAAEMPPDRKNQISHRSAALRAIRPSLQQILSHAQDAG